MDEGVEGVKMVTDAGVAQSDLCELLDVDDDEEEDFIDIACSIGDCVYEPVEAFRSNCVQVASDCWSCAFMTMLACFSLYCASLRVHSSWCARSVTSDSCPRSNMAGAVFVVATAEDEPSRRVD